MAESRGSGVLMQLQYEVSASAVEVLAHVMIDMGIEKGELPSDMSPEDRAELVAALVAGTRRDGVVTL
jgi:hypothetical protein